MPDVTATEELAIVETADRADAPGTAERSPAEAETILEDELLVEDVSIDGMCGVY